MSKTLVIGLGNPLMGDEGIGNTLVAELAKNPISPDIEYLDLGTSNFNVLHVVSNKQKVIFIDCAFMGCEPGTIRKFKPSDVKTVKKTDALSMHSGDLFHVLELSALLGECPKEIIIFGIEPAEIMPGEGLSSVLSSNILLYLHEINAELVRAC